ncbi:MAG: DUF4367 domain-containing protein [Ruminococcus sp.]|nr:DUF4367 domain-containing protein [Ruminococcus sp.]
MNDEMLGAAARSVCEPDLARLCSYDKLGEYEFSEEFENRMRRIFKPEKRINLRRRIKTALLIAAIFAAGFCMGMTNKIRWDYTSEDCDNGRMLSFNIGSVEDCKKHLDEIYTISAPRGFDCFITDNTSYSSMQIWQDAPSDGRLIYFYQTVAAAYRDAYYPDETELTMVEENGVQYMFGEIEESDYTSVVWYQYGYVFFLSGNLSKEEYLDLAKSLKIKDTQ